MNITDKTVAYAQKQIGCRYSQQERMKEGVYDCSSLIYREYKANGYDFLRNKDTHGLTSSMYLVLQTDFELIWPEINRVNLGRQFISATKLRKQGYEPQKGDVIYFCNDAKTTRVNKITHVALVESGETMIHARGSKWGVRRDPLVLYDESFSSSERLKNGNIVAVCRLKSMCNRDDGKNDLSPGNEYQGAVCVGNGVHIRKGAGVAYPSLGKLNRNDQMLAKKSDGEWIRVMVKKEAKQTEGYMHKAYVIFL